MERMKKGKVVGQKVTGKDKGLCLYVLIIQQKNCVISMNQDKGKSLSSNELEEKEEQKLIKKDSKIQKTKSITKGNNVGRPSKKTIKQEKGLQNDEQFSKQGLNRPLWQQIMVVFINFFDKTANKKGFVFSKDVRAKLSKFIRNINWSEQQQWDYITERTKISKLCAFYQFSQEQKEKLCSIMLQSSGIFAQECTEEYYHIFLNTYQRLKEQNREREGMEQEKTIQFQRQGRFIELAQNIMANRNNQYFFFSYQFIQKCSIELKRPQSLSPYIDLILSLKKCLQQL